MNSHAQNLFNVIIKECKFRGYSIWKTNLKKLTVK